ncbi:hypothetical protein [Flavobacterium soyangense]|uniref:DUF3300 domain-containing protein n=1 Tax=Flavobacterium soyangense TaxID=2023265 RepID=A0A930UC84_9FLAO|nr:hypothetical protein [Flavobacterium soyangense]MBF2708641.1 hypothetical protein [Flavobacterium soyangense]
MKKIIFVLVFLTTSLLCASVFSQIGNEPLALGLPGDNLNLYAVLDVFQKSPTLEEFERRLNDKESNINNLDLNNDNVIDYIEVIGNKNNNSFSVVLRVAINNYEYQDVAVIEGHKNYAGKVIVQIIGDEDLYGKNFIIEPSFSENPNPGYVGNQRVIVTGSAIYYANDWPIIAYLFSPVFSVYISPWHWGFYPTYWHPWSPIFFHVYWDFHRHYYTNNFYRRSGYIRYPISHSYYFKKRQTSSIVRQYKRDGRYNGVYDGRTYKKPMAPERRIITPSSPTRSVAPSRTQPGTPSGARPWIHRITPPTTRPATQPVSPSTTRQATKKVVPSATRPETRPWIHRAVPSTTRPVGKPVPPSSDKSERPGNRRD